MTTPPRMNAAPRNWMAEGSWPSSSQANRIANSVSDRLTNETSLAPSRRAPLMPAT
jgi:hypothetical protein